MLHDTGHSLDALCAFSLLDGHCIVEIRIKTSNKHTTDWMTFLLIVLTHVLSVKLLQYNECLFLYTQENL